MSQKIKQMPRLLHALDKKSYHWLAANDLDTFDAVEGEILAGSTPEEIKVFVLKWTGREEIALRCEQAARYAISLQIEK